MSIHAWHIPPVGLKQSGISFYSVVKKSHCDNAI